MSDRILARISELVERDLPKLPEHLRKWAESHLVTPRKETFVRPFGEGTVDLWLVTDNTGREDSGHRVIYNEELDMLGVVEDRGEGLDLYDHCDPDGFAAIIMNM